MRGSGRGSRRSRPTGAPGPGPTRRPVHAVGVASTFLAHANRGEYVPPDLDDVEHMCALLTGCEKLPLPPNFIPADFASCVKRFSEEMTGPGGIESSLTLRECGLQANSCSSLRTCALRGANSEACNGRGKQGFAGFCDVDGRALTCRQGQIVAVRDCSRGQEQCIVREGRVDLQVARALPGGHQGGRQAALLTVVRDAPASLREGQTCEPRLRGLRAQVLDQKKKTDGTSACATAGPRRARLGVKARHEGREHGGRVLQRARGTGGLRLGGARLLADGGRDARRRVRRPPLPRAAGAIRPRRARDGAERALLRRRQAAVALLQGDGASTSATPLPRRRRIARFGES